MGMCCKKEDNDWVKKCMTWREVAQKDCHQALKLNREDAMDHSRWRKLIKYG